MKARYRARSRMKIASMLGIIWAFSFSVRLLAQDTPQPVIGGFQVHCADAEGDVVVTRFVSQGGDIAWSTIQPFPPEPLIFINLPKARQLPQLLQLFAYAHECGHHVSGDVIRGVILKENVPDREKTADRIGIRLLRDQFRIKPNQADVIAQFFQNNPPFPGYLPGPERAQWIRDCYTTSNDACTSSPHPTPAPVPNSGGSPQSQPAAVAARVHPIENIAKDYSNDESYTAGDLVPGSHGGQLIAFKQQINQLVEAAKNGFSYVRLNDPDLIDISVAISWSSRYRNCDLQDTDPVSCLFTLQRDSNGNDLLPVYDNVKSALIQILAGWQMNEKSSNLTTGQSTGTLKSLTLEKDGQKVILSIYCGDGYYLNLDFFAPPA